MDNAKTAFLDIWNAGTQMFSLIDSLLPIGFRIIVAVIGGLIFLIYRMLLKGGGGGGMAGGDSGIKHHLFIVAIAIAIVIYPGAMMVAVAVGAALIALIVLIFSLLGSVGTMITG